MSRLTQQTVLALISATLVGLATTACQTRVEFVQEVPGTEISFLMKAIPAGTFTMGTASDEAGRQDCEGPQHEVTIRSFWMAECEVSWDLYDLWAQSTNEVDGVSRPTAAYVDMDFGMGHDGHPAICMTQLAAKTFCEWLSKVTGRAYRLPTEAEWEYACRAGTTTAYSFGDDATELAKYAWFEDNSEEEYHPIGEKLANPWGLKDMHGNVAEWTLDAFAKYSDAAADNPLVPLGKPTDVYPRAVRGGSWEDVADRLRSGGRLGSDDEWKSADPQIPKSIWYHTDAQFLGFRIVCDPPAANAR